MSLTIQQFKRQNKLRCYPRFSLSTLRHHFLVHRDVIGLITLNVVLMIILSRVADIAFIV